MASISACASAAPSVQAAPASSLATTTTSTTTVATTTDIITTAPPTTPSSTAATRPEWLGNRTLPTDGDGNVAPQTTPEELLDRRLPTLDTLPPPTSKGFTVTVEPLAGEPLERSTWVEGCPVPPEELSYLTLTFWGFDERPHTGELIVHSTVDDDVAAVFEQLYAARFPIEEMRIVTQADLDADPTGDTNNTTAYVCRPITGGTRFSEHAYGLAIDINPFHNPYARGDLVLPELATFFQDRRLDHPGQILEGDVVTEAFDQIGWSWGGRWTSLKDYQHFSLKNR